MKKIYVVLFAAMASVIGLQAQQLPDPHFEDWSGTKFDGEVQPKYWHGSNVEQSALGLTFRFNFTHQASGRSGYCVMVQDQKVGAAGIEETSPGYFGLGTAWQYLEGLSTSTATAGTHGGISWTYRPDTISVWIRRTGDHTEDEDFHILYYAWSGTSKGASYMNKNRGCTSTEVTNEESDIRQDMDGNECKTSQKANQIAEGWLRARAQYNNWTQVKVPIVYMNSDVPTMCNVIFSASNYPNFRANDGLYEENSLYVDDVELIYSSKIGTLYVGDKEWKGFDPDSEEEQVYSLGENATSIPTIEAWRGSGKLTNTKGTTKTYNGRKLSGNEISMTSGTIDGTPVTITVRAEDGSSTHTYKIKFVRAASTNANLSGITVNGEALSSFKASTTTYNVELPFGTTKAPVVDASKGEDSQTIAISQASSVTGTATIDVTAADLKTTKRYTLKFSVAQLKDNTLQNILVNGEGVPGFIPSQTIYKVALPIGTDKMPTVEAVSAYPAGAQTIVYTAPTKIDGGTYQISVTTPGNQTPKVYKLNFKLEASSYSRLKDLQMGGYIMNFNPDNLTYYVNLPMGTTKLPEITYVPGDPYQAVPEIQEGGLDGTTRVIVTAANGDQTVYKIIVATKKSSRSDLQNIFINGEALQGFSANTFKYTVNLPVGTDKIPTVTFTKGDEYETVNISYGGLNEVTRITVTAGDGSTSIYQITFVVQKSNNMSLKDIQVGGVSLAGFTPETLEYTYTLAKGQAVPTVTAVKGEDSQTVNERKVTSAPGDYKLTVVAESGVKQTYIIHFVLNLSHNADLAAILLNGTPMEGFLPDKKEYEITLPAGQSIIPEVSFTKGDKGQKVIVSENKNTYTLQVTAEDGVTPNTYTVKFIIKVSANAKLKDIMLDGESWAKFHPDTMRYTYEIEAGKMPVISVVKSDSAQQVTIAAPTNYGKASIMVAAESGDKNTYVIDFVKKASDAVLLKAITVNGVNIMADPTKEDYTVEYYDQIPTVGYEAKEGQTVSTIETRDDENNPQTLLYVQVGSDTKTYSITFNRQYHENATLADIKLNNKLIEGWNPTTLDYTYKLQAGEEEPTITFIKGEENQTVVFGQKAQGVYQLAVLAADGKNKNVYTVTFEQPDLYTSTVLEETTLGGVPFEFSKSNTHFGGEIPEGNMLPEFGYKRISGQTVVVTDSSATAQKIIVVAENGNTATYTITYTRTAGTDATLKAILLDGENMKGFNSAVTEYTVELEERTEEVPAITPVSDIIGQVYTIRYGRVNTPTTIEVLAKDGKTTKTYTIQFNVKKLTNTKLSRLWVEDAFGATAELMTDPNVTEYTHELDVDAMGIPTVYFTRWKDEEGKEEKEQQIDYTVGRGGETWVKVTAQSGDSRTYHVQFTKKKPEQANVLKKIYVNGNDVTGKDTIDLAYTETKFEITYEKNFDTQAVIVNNGGVGSPSQLIVMANHQGVADKVYTLVPRLPEFDPEGKLESLTFGGNPVPNFRPNVYNYVVNVTAEPKAANFVGTTFDGETVTTDQIDHTKKEVKLIVPGEKGETYHISWFYTNCEPPFDFEWIDTDKAYGWTDGVFASLKKGTIQTSTGTKPRGWKVPADCSSGFDYDAVASTMSYQTGMEVLEVGNAASLNTCRSSSMNGSMPGVMTTGELTLSWGASGGTTLTVSEAANKGFVYKNTPESFAFDYSPRATKGGINAWSAWAILSDGSNISKKSFTNGNYSDLKKWKTAIIPLNVKEIGTVARANIMICSSEISGNSFNCYGGSTVKTSSLIVRDLHFVYNSTISSATVDGHNANVDNSAKTISYEFSDPEYAKIPNIKFVGEVSDQEQQFRDWKPEVLEGDKMVRRATLRNFGEDHSYTDYNLAISRPAVTSNDLDSILWGEKGNILAGTETDYTIYRTSPLDTFPCIKVYGSSIHQQVTVVRDNDTLRITVTPEVGDAKVYTVRFVEPDNSNNATLASVTGITLTEGQFDYTVTETQLSNLNFTKQNMYQTVTMTHTLKGAEIAVTANDNTSKNIYHFNLPVNPTTAELGLIAYGDQKLWNPEKRIEEKEMPDIVLFERKDASDTVRQVITTNSIEWTVYGTNNKQTEYKLVSTTNADSIALLKGLRVNGEDYEMFDPEADTLLIPTDTMVTLTAVPLNIGQTISMSFHPKNRGNAKAAGLAQSFVFEFHVIATDGKHDMNYTFILESPKSSDATLKAIIIGNDTLTNIAQSMSYTLAIPQGPKTAEPALPKIQYIPTDPQASVEVVPALINNTNYITVTPADGNEKLEKEYNLLVEAQKSTYAQLNGIMIDGKPIADFEPDRYFYSVQVEPDIDHKIVPSSEDLYQTYEISPMRAAGEGQKKILVNVKAEDGMHSERYLIELYEASQSNVVTLKDIIVDGKSLPGFSPMQNTYDTILPATATKTPDVRAVMMADGQTVTIDKNGWDVTLEVVAPNQKDTNTYSIHFTKPRSSDVTLKMIMLDGDSLPGFTPEQKIYQIALPVGKHELPTIYAQRNVSVQQMPIIQPSGMKAEIIVTAEDGNRGLYTLLFTETFSDADTLLAVYANNQLIEGFNPKTFYYALTLPVEQVEFPELTWEEADEWQTITLDTLQIDSVKMMCQIEVIAENEHKNIYTITYERELWDVDTLQMIYVDNKPLEGFKANVYDYSVILPAGTTSMPTVSYDTNDKYQQKISIVPSVDSIATKSLNEKVNVIVTAPNGNSRTYTIHFPIELSSEASLNLIQYGGQVLPGFDAERTMYRVDLPIGTKDVPVITVIKKEEAQKVDINTNDWTVTIDVVAEDGSATKQYTIEFGLAKSTYSLLDSIIYVFEERVDSLAIYPDVFEYSYALPIGSLELPTIEVVAGDSMQTVDIAPIQLMLDGTYYTTITVTAADEETQSEYVLTFIPTRNNDANLRMIFLRGDSLEGFHTDSLEYHIEFPTGTTVEQYYTLREVTYTLSDKYATDTIWQDEQYTIFIEVTAQDGTRNTYSITQSTGLSDDNWLADILLDSVSYRDFDPEEQFYTYYIATGKTAPEVTAIPRDSTAEVFVKPGQAVGDTTLITCIAENGDSRAYRIWFTFTSIDDAQTPEPQDVLVKRLFGSGQILVASIRQNVAFALYDQYGHLVEYVQRLPQCDPNDAIMAVNANGQEYLADIVDEKSGAILTLEMNTIYFYGFYENEKRRITSGKLIIVNSPVEK